MIRATILMHATDQADPARLDHDVWELCPGGSVSHVTGAYDLILTLDVATDRQLAQIVLALQALPSIARTITLVHVITPPGP